MKYKFNSPRYLTAGVNSRLSYPLQLFLWQLIDQRKTKSSMDYLQVFHLYTDINKPNVQFIRHSQEKPPYIKELKVTLPEPINQKVYVIDDVTHTTMLLGEEY